MAYNLLDLRTRVRKKIKDTAYDADSIDGFVYDAICEIAALYPWKEFQKIVTGALTVGEYTFEQQDDHELTTRLIMVHPTNANSYWNMTKWYLPSDTFFERFPSPEDNGSSQPVYWTEHGDQIYFNCPVNLAYELRQFYQRVPTELTADADVPDLPITFREAIVLGASYRCEEERDNYDIAAVLQNRFNDKVGDLIIRHANTTLTGPDTIVYPHNRDEDT